SARSLSWTACNLLGGLRTWRSSSERRRKRATPVSIRGGSHYQYEHERFTLCYSHYSDQHLEPWQMCQNAMSPGCRKSTIPMQHIRSMCRDIERQIGDEDQIPGKRIEPQRPLLDTLPQHDGVSLFCGDAFAQCLRATAAGVKSDRGALQPVETPWQTVYVTVRGQIFMKINRGMRNVGLKGL